MLPIISVGSPPCNTFLVLEEADGENTIIIGQAKFSQMIICRVKNFSQRL